MGPLSLPCPICRPYGSRSAVSGGLPLVRSACLCSRSPHMISSEIAERLRFPPPHESAFRCGVRNRSTSVVIARMSASAPLANR
jgi:hypothetical protein